MRPERRSRLQGALARLIEIAIRIRNFDGIDQYFVRLERLPPSSVEAATAYFKAKYLYSVAVPADAPIGAEVAPDLDLSGTPPPVTGGRIDQDRLEQARVASEKPAAEKIAADRGDIFLVGGTESMTRYPLLYRDSARKFYRLPPA